MADDDAGEPDDAATTRVLLANITYPDEAFEKWRWVERDEDAAEARFVVAWTDATVAELVLRGSLDWTTCPRSSCFVARRVFLAYRVDASACIAALAEGCLALGLMVADPSRVEWRDVAMAGSELACAATYRGMDLTPLVEPAAAVAIPAVADLLRHAAGAQNVYLPERCLYRVTPTAHGVVLLDRGQHLYGPERDLATIGLAIAAVIEAEGTYWVNSVRVGEDIPIDWLTAGATDAHRALGGLTGCVEIAALQRGSESSDHDLRIRVAEAATAEDASTIVAACRGEDARSVVAGYHEGRICAVLVATSDIWQEPRLETKTSMTRFLAAVGPHVR